jgi:hypothetical protein
LTLKMSGKPFKSRFINLYHEYSFKLGNFINKGVSGHPKPDREGQVKTGHLR